MNAEYVETFPVNCGSIQYRDGNLYMEMV